MDHDHDFRDRPHIHIRGGGRTETYTSPRKGATPPLPKREREAHARALEHAIGEALIGARHQLATRDPNLAVGSPAFYLEVELDPAQRVAIDHLSNRVKGLEVVAVREPEGSGAITAAVLVPQSAESYFLNKVKEYRTQEVRSGRPRNENLVARMETVRLGTVYSLFTDDPSLYPSSGMVIWWEVWLRRDTLDAFALVAHRLNIVVKPHTLKFPEREVVLALADEATIGRAIQNSNAVAELRVAKDTPAPFLQMKPPEQVEWANDLLQRLIPPHSDSPSVCILDSGVTYKHPLLKPGLEVSDLHTYDPNWGVADDHNRWQGHGTAMAGVALYGDLRMALEVSSPVVLAHRLESVKILPPDGKPENDPELYGYVTREGIARAEVQAPHRRRAICVAISNENHNSRGRPSSWSSEIDQLCSERGSERLIILAAGNIRTRISASDYPDRNDVESVHDPAQAWNAITVGAYTDKVVITDPDYAHWRPIAPPGDLSPCSRTSVSWSRQWPIKPDVVFEGGNLAADGEGPGDTLDDLRLLTTYHMPMLRLFTTFGDTSGATALASRMAAEIWAVHPNFWPETVRGLIVHSAEWTPAMRARVQNWNRKEELHPLLRRYGYGVPDLKRALKSARNDLTLQIEDELQPFEKSDRVKTREMKLHLLPWPREELARLGGQQVELRVTLSYFIEPNPSERGWTRRNRYASHGLRFAMKGERRRSMSSDNASTGLHARRTRVEVPQWHLQEPNSGYLGHFATAGQFIRISGMAQQSSWLNATQSRFSQWAGGGRRSHSWNAGIREPGTRSL